MTAAAERVEPVLRRDFAASYAGLVLDHPDRTLFVYRKPNVALEARTRALATGVTVEFRDAQFSLSELQSLASRVMADLSYWNQRGVTVSAAGPRPDGSGIEVMASSALSSDEVAERYGIPANAVTVNEGDIIPPIGKPWTPPPSSSPRPT